MADHSPNRSDKSRGGYQNKKDYRPSKTGGARGHRSEGGGFGGRRQGQQGSRAEGETYRSDRSGRTGQNRYKDGKGQGRNRASFNRKDGDARGKNRDFKRGSRQESGQRETLPARQPKESRPAARAPEIDADVTGKELENWALRALRQLESQNAETVAKHLVMVGRYLDLDPQFALEHALAASRRAGRIGLVREVVGIAAYAADNYTLALRELRTHRRISGSNDHLALLVDCERALGRVEKALSLAEEARQEEVAPGVRSEVAIVVAGIYRDAGDLKKAIAALEIPELNPRRGFDYSPRLFSTYADLLAEDGQKAEARRWAHLAKVTEAALGQGEFAEPEIFDIFTEESLFDPADEQQTEAPVNPEEEAGYSREEALEPVEGDEPSVEEEVAELLGENPPAAQTTPATEDQDRQEAEPGTDPEPSSPAEAEKEDESQAAASAGLQTESLFDELDGAEGEEQPAGVESVEAKEEDALFSLEQESERD